MNLVGWLHWSRGDNFLGVLGRYFTISNSIFVNRNYHWIIDRKVSVYSKYFSCISLFMRNYVHTPEPFISFQVRSSCRATIYPSNALLLATNNVVQSKDLGFLTFARPCSFLFLSMHRLFIASCRPLKWCLKWLARFVIQYKKNNLIIGYIYIYTHTCLVSDHLSNKTRYDRYRSGQTE